MPEKWGRERRIREATKKARIATAQIWIGQRVFENNFERGMRVFRSLVNKVSRCRRQKSGDGWKQKKWRKFRRIT